ncbi:MAG TPA: hypothetical protein VI757_06370 [Bacteroidia bacterium]|nr:hypothetical protein [Bacteroidia bacterium]
MSLTREQKLELKKLQRLFGKLEGIAAAEKMSVDEYIAHLGDNKEEAEAFRKFLAGRVEERKNIFEEKSTETPVNLPYFGSF